MARKVEIDFDGLISEGKDIGAMVAGMIASRKWLDKDELFKEKIANDPTFKDGIIYKHFGLLKFAGAYYAKEKFMKNSSPMVRLALVGVMIDGLLTEAGEVLTNKDGQRFFPLGKSNSSDAEMENLLRNAIIDQRNFRQSPALEYPTSVAGGSVNLDENSSNSVAGMGMRFVGFGDY